MTLSGRFPDGTRLATLVRELTSGNERFAALRSDGTVGTHREDHKTPHHPAVGPMTVSCDVLADGDSDLEIVVTTAAPGSPDEVALQLATLGRRPHREHYDR